jgi:DNA polymerase elongation subunit (family B)
VPPADLVIERRVSKEPAEYRYATLTVAALRRAERLGSGLEPGQTVSYLVGDEDGHTGCSAETDGGVRIDADWYRERAIRAVTDLLGAVGWDADDVRRRLADGRSTTLDAY